jgi:hypothetical protein
MNAEGIDAMGVFQTALSDNFLQKFAFTLP